MVACAAAVGCFYHHVCIHVPSPPIAIPQAQRGAGPLHQCRLGLLDANFCGMHACRQECMGCMLSHRAAPPRLPGTIYEQLPRRLWGIWRICGGLHESSPAAAVPSVLLTLTHERHLSSSGACPTWRSAKSCLEGCPSSHLGWNTVYQKLTVACYAGSHLWGLWQSGSNASFEFFPRRLALHV